MFRYGIKKNEARNFHLNIFISLVIYNIDDMAEPWRKLKLKIHMKFDRM